MRTLKEISIDQVVANIMTATLRTEHFVSASDYFDSLKKDIDLLKRHAQKTRKPYLKILSRCKNKEIKKLVRQNILPLNLIKEKIIGKIDALIQNFTSFDFQESPFLKEIDEKKFIFCLYLSLGCLNQAKELWRGFDDNEKKYLTTKYEFSFFHLSCLFDQLQSVQWAFEEYRLQLKGSTLDVLQSGAFGGFHAAVSRGNLNILRYLWEKIEETGVDPVVFRKNLLAFNGFCIFSLACKSDQSNILKWLLNTADFLDLTLELLQSEGGSLSPMCALNSSDPVIRVLTTAAALGIKEDMLDTQLNSAFETACRYGHFKIVKLLIEEGKALDRLPAMLEFLHFSAFHLTLRLDTYDIADLLLEEAQKISPHFAKYMLYNIQIFNRITSKGLKYWLAKHKSISIDPAEDMAYSLLANSAGSNQIPVKHAQWLFRKIKALNASYAIHIVQRYDHHFKIQNWLFGQVEKIVENKPRIYEKFFISSCHSGNVRLLAHLLTKDAKHTFIKTLLLCEKAPPNFHQPFFVEICRSGNTVVMQLLWGEAERLKITRKLFTLLIGRDFYSFLVIPQKNSMDVLNFLLKKAEPLHLQRKLLFSKESSFGIYLFLSALTPSFGLDEENRLLLAKRLFKETKKLNLFDEKKSVNLDAVLHCLLNASNFKAAHWFLSILTPEAHKHSLERIENGSDRPFTSAVCQFIKDEKLLLFKEKYKYREGRLTTEFTNPDNTTEKWRRHYHGFFDEQGLRRMPEAPITTQDDIQLRV